MLRLIERRAVVERGIEMTLASNASMNGTPPSAAPIKGKSIVCFSANDWSDIPSSKAHIMRSLGRANKVMYIDTLGIRTPRFSNHDFKRAVQKIKLSIRGLRNVENSLYVWSPPAIPFHGSPVGRRINATVLSIAINRLMARLNMEDAVVWSYLPNAIGIIKKLRASKVVYHCIDDYAEFTDCPKTSFQQMEREMLETADLTVVSSKRLLELRRPDAKQIAYVPHGVDLDFFRAAAKADVFLPDMTGIRKPIAGFVGRIADWVDLDLIARCASVMPDWSFVLVGPSNVDLRRRQNPGNVHFLGRKEHEDIPHYIKMFDVCLIPFVENDLVESVNPLKMYEYLALGKPVVSTPMAELRAHSDVVAIAEGKDFATAIQQAYLSDTDMARRARIEAVSTRSWATVTNEIMALLSKDKCSPGDPGSKNNSAEPLQYVSPLSCSSD